MQRYTCNKTVRLHLLLFIIFLLTMVAGCNFKPQLLKPGQNIRGLLRVDAAGPFHIGDSIPLVLTVEAKTGFTYRLPDFSDPVPGGLELKSKQASVTETFPGGTRKAIRYIFTGWQAGEYTIPEAVITFEAPDRRPGTLKLDSPKIRLVSVLPQGISEAELLTFDIQGIKYPLSLAPRYSLLKWYLLGALVLGLILLLFRVYRRHILKLVAASAEIDIEPAHTVALHRLTHLRTMALSESADFKTFYSELSECIREYMENRYSIRALEMTTEEFLTHLTSGTCLSHEQQLLLKSFMEQSDLVKFARQSPSRREAEKALDDIEQLVEATKETPAAVQTTPQEQLS
jgi:hypothetical protein